MKVLALDKLQKYKFCFLDLLPNQIVNKYVDLDAKGQFKFAVMFS